MRHTLRKICSLALFVPLGAGGYVRPDQSETSASSSPALVAKKIVAAKSHRFKIRTVTAGVNLKNTADLATVESAIGFLQRARTKLEAEGYEIQTLRIATQPMPEYLNGKSRGAALADLRKIDEVISAQGVILRIGAVITGARDDPECESWTTQLDRQPESVHSRVT